MDDVIIISKSNLKKKKVDSEMMQSGQTCRSIQCSNHIFFPGKENQAQEMR